jgi:hypothetical protein
MPQSQYSHAHKARQAAGLAPKENNSMRIDGANVVDETGARPQVPPKQSPQLPSDDSSLRWRTEQA